MDFDKKLIGIRIMQQRKTLGLTQEDLAEQIGFSKNHISSIERGIYLPTTQFILGICNVLGETPDYYLIGKISKETDKLTTLVKSLPVESQKMVCSLLETYLNQL